MMELQSINTILQISYFEVRFGKRQLGHRATESEAVSLVSICVQERKKRPVSVCVCVCVCVCVWREAEQSGVALSDKPRVAPSNRCVLCKGPVIRQAS